MNSTSADLHESIVNDVNSIIEEFLIGGIRRKPKIAKGTRNYLAERFVSVKHAICHISWNQWRDFKS